MLRLPPLTLQPGLRRSPEIVDSAHTCLPLQQLLEQLCFPLHHARRQRRQRFLKAALEHIRPLRGIASSPILDQRSSDTHKRLRIPLVPEAVLERNRQQREPVESVRQMSDTRFQLHRHTYIGKLALGRDPERSIGSLQYRFADLQKTRSTTPRSPLDTEKPKPLQKLVLRQTGGIDWSKVSALGKHTLAQM